MNRRIFLRTLGRAGLGAAAVGALPRWSRAAIAARLREAEPDLIERNTWPEHWETSIAALGRAWATPNDVFFVRSHFPVPEIDLDDYRLEVAGLVRTPLRLSLADLARMTQHEEAVTLECAGNGRGRLALPSTSGTQWGYGAVGNAAWGGVALAALLERAGVAHEARHVWFEAADHAPHPAVPRFVRSIPIEKARADVLLALRMNGAPLPILHGAPVRAIVPGWFGMASTKWVTRVRVEAMPSDNHFIAKGYRYVYPGEDPAHSSPVDEMRVKSLITSPLEGAPVRAGTVRVHGVAWAGSAGVRGVELSSDGGATWRGARLDGRSSRFAWRVWSAEVSAAPGARTLRARATDGAGNVQPMQARANAGGYGNNSIQVVTIHVA